MDTVPTAGDTVQVTLVLLASPTVALMVTVCPALSEVEVGDTEMVTGRSDMVALALMLVLAALVAFTVTVEALPMTLGAV